MKVKVWNGGGEISTIGTFKSVTIIGTVVFDEEHTVILELIGNKWRDDNDDLWVGWSVEVAS